jgi:hypothetical protein
MPVNPHPAPPPTLPTKPVDALAQAQAQANAIAQGKDPLSIGEVTFNTDEVPEDLEIGAAEQMIVAKTLPGGTRVVQRFGNDPLNVAWTGKFMAANVKPRVAQLRAYQVAGTTVLLSWLNEKYHVTIKSFKPKYHNANYADYEIEVVVISDANGAFTIASSTTIDAQVAALQAQVNANNAVIVHADPTGSQTFQQQLANVYRLLALAAPLAQGVVGQSGNAIISAIAGTMGLIAAYQGTLSTLSAQYADVIQLQGALAAISGNVATGQNPKSVQTQGGNLFNIAAQQYGDVSLAFKLASANGVFSPFLPSGILQAVSLPPFAT